MGDPIAAGQGTIKSSPPFCVIWISNNVPYIGVLEYGLFEPPNPGVNRDGDVKVSGGYSVQAPEGMVMVTLAELRTMF